MGIFSVILVATGLFDGTLTFVVDAPTYGPKTTTPYWMMTSSSPQWATTQSPSPEMFFNNHDRDTFIMQLSSEMLGVKAMLSSLVAKLENLSTNPSGSGGPNPASFVAFMARLSDRISGLGMDQIIHFDDVILNKGNGFDSRLGIFRCPMAGTYQFSLSIGSYGGIQLEIINNGRQIGRVFTSRSRFGRGVEDVVEEATVMDEEGAEEEEEEEKGINKRAYTTYWPGHLTGTTGFHAGSEATPGSAQAIVDLNVGDEVWVRHASDNQHDILFGNGMSTFSGHLLSPASK